MKNIFTIFFLAFTFQCFSQADSVTRPKADTGRPPKTIVKPDTGKQLTAPALSARVDSVAAKVGSNDSLRRDSLKQDSMAKQLIKAKAAAAKKNERVAYDGQQKAYSGKEELFYILAGLLLFLGVVKVAYPKYFQSIFRQFFQTSLRQKQTPEQIVQGYVPGFLLNLLFCMVGGMLIAMYGINQGFFKGPLWLLIVYCSGILGCIYLLKYGVTLFTGWVFNVKEAAGTYRFIVFLINRVLGIVLMPLLILLSFYGGGAQQVIFTIAASLVMILLIYRYALSLTVIGKNLKVSALHFFIYLCAVELMPLLVIYKVLFILIAGNK